MRQLLFVLPIVALLVSCGKDEATKMLIGTGVNDTERAEALFTQAKAADDAGKRKKAIKLYDRVADNMHYTDRAAEARFRQAQLLEEAGEPLAAFDAYQDLLATRQGSGFYKQAFDRQSQMAFAVANNEIKKSFIGFKSPLSVDEKTEMLAKVAANAPRSPTAAKASFLIGDILAADGQSPEAVRAYEQTVENYPSSPQAPEAQFRVGQILLEEAENGNQDQANLERAEAAFQDYLSQFPGHKHNAEARKKIAGIGSRDLSNTFEIGEFYEKKGDLSSARFYYEEVTRRTKSGELHDKAQARLSALKSN